MVTVGDVDADLEGEIKEECSKYGEVKKVVIHVDRQNDGSMPPPDSLAKVFVEYINNAGRPSWLGTGRGSSRRVAPMGLFLVNVPPPMFMPLPKSFTHASVPLTLSLLAANAAVEALDGRWFAKRNIKAQLYDADKFAAGNFA
jgi:hypothetical protein